MSPEERSLVRLRDQLADLDRVLDAQEAAAAAGDLPLLADLQDAGAVLIAEANRTALSSPPASRGTPPAEEVAAAALAILDRYRVLTERLATERDHTGAELVRLMPTGRYAFPIPSSLVDRTG